VTAGTQNPVSSFRLQPSPKHSVAVVCAGRGMAAMGLKSRQGTPAHMSAWAGSSLAGVA